jgi:HSP20 family protein
MRVLIPNGKDPSRVRHHDELLEFDRLFAPRGAHGRFEPNTDVHLDEEGRAFVVHAELAGAEADSLRVYVDDVYLFIAGERAMGGVSRKASLLRKEIQSGAFVKRIELPVPVDHDGASAVYRDGILTIRLPLAQSTKFPMVRTQIRMTVRRTPA